MTAVRRIVLAVISVGTVALLVPQGAGADGIAAPPTIAVDHARVRPGDKVIVVFNDWQSRVATLVMCGNLARRGSTDCDQVGSEGVALQIGAPRMIAEFTISSPPVPCPCVIEALGADHQEAAFAPVDLVGAPVAPVVGPSFDPPVAIDLSVRRASSGATAWLRSALGGPTTYAVDISIRNLSRDVVSGETVNVSVGRNATDVLRSVDVAPPAPIPPGQTWKHQERLMVPPPVIGRFMWKLTGSGVGPAVHADATARATPWAFVVLLAAWAADLMLIAMRRFRRDAHGGMRAFSLPAIGTIGSELA